MNYYGSAPGHYLEPGTRLNNIYEIENVVGEGGMGVVYRGRAIETGDAVAIKVIRAEMAGNESALALFRKEASVLNNLLHEAIVRYYVFTRDPVIDRPYLATEFVDGVSLADISDRHALPRADVVELTIRPAEGLQAAHRLGVLHRDISPDNIILPDGDVKKAKIIDFGIARATQFGGKTVIGDSIAGKFDYMSPEQLGLYGGNVTPRSDMYSLGIVLAEAALGRHLDMGGTQAAVIEKRRTVPKLEGIEPRLKALLSHMLQPKPADRPETMTEIAATARSIAGAPQRTPRRGVAILAAVVVMVGTVGAILYGRDAVNLMRPQATGTDDSEVVVATPPKLIPAENNSGTTGGTAAPANTPDATPTPDGTATEGTNASTDGATGSASNNAAGTAGDTLSAADIVAALGGDQIAPNTPRDGPAEEIRMSGENGEDQTPAATDDDGSAATGADAGTDTGDGGTTSAPGAPATSGTAPAAGNADVGTGTAPAADPATGGAGADTGTTGAAAGGAATGIDPGTDTTGAATETTTGTTTGMTGNGAGATGTAAGNAASPAGDDPTAAAGGSTSPTNGTIGGGTTLSVGDGPAAAPVQGSGGDGVDPIDDTGPADGTNGRIDTTGLDPKLQVPPADPPPTAGEAGVRRYIAQYDAGECTYIRPTQLGARYAKLEAFGDQVPPFVQFDENFARSLGFEADIGLRLVKPAQCPAVEFLRQLKNAGAEPLDLSLDNDTIRSGFALTGTISGLGDRQVVILVINEDGRVYPIDAVSNRDGGTATIHTRISGGPQALQPHLLMVVAATDMPDAATAQRKLAPDFFSALERSLSGRERNVKAQLAYFKFGG